MSILFRLLCFALILLSGVVQASGFSAAVSPPRYELSANPGQVLRQVLEIHNLGGSDEQYNIRSSDWMLRGDDLTFSDALLPNSCRPWVKLERHRISVRKADKRKFRFEVHVPPNAPVQECRFALLVEGRQPTPNQVNGGLNVPVNGRLAVVVYLAIGGAQPQLQVNAIRLAGGKAVLQVQNRGNAHGRLQGTLAGVDGSGKALNLSVSSMPVMPGETRMLELTPHLNGTRHRTGLRSPLSVKGQVYWSKGAFAIDKRL